MKSMNFPARKNTRRIGALDRLRKSLGYWFSVDGPNSANICRRIKQEIKILERRTISNACDIRTKKYRGDQEGA